MTSSQSLSSDKSLHPPVSVISSNYDNLELAKAKAGESIINVNQFFPGTDTEIKVYSDKLSCLGDNSEELNEEDIKFKETETKVNYHQKTIPLLGIEKDENKNEENDEDTMIRFSRFLTPSSGEGNLRTLPSLKQILDTAASEHYLTGMIALKEAKWSEALAKFTKCVMLRPYEPSYYANRAEVHLQLTDIGSAIANYKHACLLQPDNQAFFDRLGFLYVFQGQLMFDQGCYTSALESICKAIEMFPDNQAYQIRAIVSMTALNRHSECMALIDKQIDLDDTNADFFVLRAKLHANFRNFTLCYYDLMDAIKLDPNHVEALQVLATMREHADQLKDQSVTMALHNRLYEAINKISLAIELDPICGDYHVKRGAFYRRMKDFTAAIDDFLMALDKVDHDETNETYVLAQKQLGLTFNDFGVECFQKNYVEEALILLNKAIQSSIEEPAFYTNRGDCFFRLSQWHFAKSDYEQAMFVNQDYKFMAKSRIALVDYWEGRQYFSTEKYEEAESCFSFAINNNPQITTFYILRSRNRFLLERYRDARIDLICSMLLSNSDCSVSKEIESYFKRLFPNKSREQVLQSKLAKNAKSYLSDLLRNHLNSLEIDTDKQKTNTAIVDTKETQSDIELIKNDKSINEFYGIYHKVREEIKHCFQNRSFKKTINGTVRKSSVTDIIIPEKNDACGIVGKYGGDKYFINTQGRLAKVSQPVGWRKFNSAINI